MESLHEHLVYMRVKQRMKLSHVILFFVVLLLSCNRPTIRMNDYAVHGIDVSHYQADINWDKIANQNIHFAFAKATEGMNHIDTLFCHNWAEMNRVGIVRGAYHFFRPTTSASLQAQNFVDIVEMEYGDLPPVLDVEVTDGVAEADLIEGIQTWLGIVEAETNITPIIYTNQKFFNKYLAHHFPNHPIWIARYNSLYEPHLAGNRAWDFWQYGCRGRLDGIDGDVDFNVFKGTLLELEQLCYGERMVLSSL